MLSYTYRESIKLYNLTAEIFLLYVVAVELQSWRTSEVAIVDVR